MGFLDDLLGNSAAEASRAAAADTFAKQQQAVNGITQFGDQFANDFRGLSDRFQPFVNSGVQAQNTLAALLGLQGRDAADTALNNFRADPGFQFQLDQGLNAIDRSAAARSGVQSGSTLKAAQRFGTNLADQSFGNNLSRLAALGQQGLTATGNQVNTVGTGLQGQLGTRNLGFQGNFSSANTIGQGDIAAANAQSAGAQNLLNTVSSLAGTALGGRFGGRGGFGSSFRR